MHHTPEEQSQANYAPPNHHAPVNRPLRSKLSLFISVSIYVVGDMDIYLTPLVFQALSRCFDLTGRIQGDVHDICGVNLPLVCKAKH